MAACSCHLASLHVRTVWRCMSSADVIKMPIFGKQCALSLMFKFSNTIQYCTAKVFHCTKNKKKSVICMPKEIYRGKRHFCVFKENGITEFLRICEEKSIFKIFFLILYPLSFPPPPF
jgi:hypothetical protein